MPTVAVLELEPTSSSFDSFNKKMAAKVSAAEPSRIFFFIKIYLDILQLIQTVSQSCAVDKKMNNSGGSLDNQTRQTEWKTAPVAKVQLCEYKN